MYSPSQFEETRIGTLHALLRAHPLGTLITLGAAGINDPAEALRHHIKVRFLLGRVPESESLVPLALEARTRIITFGFFHGSPTTRSVSRADGCVPARINCRN
jgi:putative FMN-binding protein